MFEIDISMLAEAIGCGIALFGALVIGAYIYKFGVWLLDMIFRKESVHERDS